MMFEFFTHLTSLDLVTRCHVFFLLFQFLRLDFATEKLIKIGGQGKLS